MKKAYTPGYRPTKTMQRKLLTETQGAINNRGEHPLTSNRSVRNLGGGGSGVFIAGLMLSAMILPLVTAQTTEPSGEGSSSGGDNRSNEHSSANGSIHTSGNSTSAVSGVTGCSMLLRSLSHANSSVHAECLLVPGNTTEQNAFLQTAFGNNTPSQRPEPNSAGVGYRSSRIMEVCLDKNNTMNIQESPLCKDSAVDLMKTHTGTQNLYNKHIPKEVKTSSQVEVSCSATKTTVTGVSEDTVVQNSREIGCTPITKEGRLHAYTHPYPVQDNSTVTSPTCPSSLTMVSDGIAPEEGVTTTSTCVPVSVRQAASFCTEASVKINRECRSGRYTNAKDCILGSNAARMLRKACPTLQISDARAVYHQSTGNANTTIPVMSITTLVEALDPILESSNSVPYVYITHPGTRIEANRHSTKLLQGYVNKLKEKGCSLIVDTGNKVLPKDDLLSGVQNITLVTSVKEALEKGFLEEIIIGEAVTDEAVREEIITEEAVKVERGSLKTNTTSTTSSPSASTANVTSATPSASATNVTSTGNITNTTSTQNKEDSSDNTSVPVGLLAALLGSLTLAGSILLCSIKRKRKIRESVNSREGIPLQDMPVAAAKARGVGAEGEESVSLVASLIHEEDNGSGDETIFLGSRHSLVKSVEVLEAEGTEGEEEADETEGSEGEESVSLVSCLMRKEDDGSGDEDILLGSRHSLVKSIEVLEAEGTEGEEEADETEGAEGEESVSLVSSLMRKEDDESGDEDILLGSRHSLVKSIESMQKTGGVEKVTSVKVVEISKVVQIANSSIPFEGSEGASSRILLPAQAESNASSSTGARPKVRQRNVNEGGSVKPVYLSHPTRSSFAPDTKKPPVHYNRPPRQDESS